MLEKLQFTETSTFSSFASGFTRTLSKAGGFTLFYQKIEKLVSLETGTPILPRFFSAIMYLFKVRSSERFIAESIVLWSKGAVPYLFDFDTSVQFQVHFF